MFCWIISRGDAVTWKSLLTFPLSGSRDKPTRISEPVGQLSLYHVLFVSRRWPQKLRSCQILVRLTWVQFTTRDVLNTVGTLRSRTWFFLLLLRRPCSCLKFQGNKEDETKRKKRMLIFLQNLITRTAKLISWIKTSKISKADLNSLRTETRFHYFRFQHPCSSLNSLMQTGRKKKC